MTEPRPPGERIAALEVFVTQDQKEHEAVWEAIKGMREDLAAIRADIARASGGVWVLIGVGGAIAAVLTLGKTLIPGLSIVFWASGKGGG